MTNYTFRRSVIELETKINRKNIQFADLVSKKTIQCRDNFDLKIELHDNITGYRVWISENQILGSHIIMVQEMSSGEWFNKLVYLTTR